MPHRNYLPFGYTIIVKNVDPPSTPKRYKTFGVQFDNCIGSTFESILWANVASCAVLNRYVLPKTFLLPDKAHNPFYKELACD